MKHINYLALEQALISIAKDCSDENVEFQINNLTTDEYNKLKSIVQTIDAIDQDRSMTKEYSEIVRGDELPKHGSPQDRGSADRYYGRPFDPHYWPAGTLKGTKVEMVSMSPAEITAYTYGYNTEQDRKDWG